VPASPDPDDRTRWRVGFYVEVEVDAYEGEAALLAEAACRWPGSLSPPREPVTTNGLINRTNVSARIIRSQALMVRKAPGGG
jgi:hypothetical protein